MKSINPILFVIVLSVIQTGCKIEEHPETTFKIQNDTVDSKNIIADTITYDVIIESTDSIDTWTNEFMKYFNKKLFIDRVFEDVYSGRTKAYDFFTNEALSKRDVKKIEKKEWFSREAIGKIQFTEIWHYDSNKIIFRKDVLSIVVGVQRFDNNKVLMGYKPVFKIYLNN